MATTESDRERWRRRYLAERPCARPSRWLTALADALPAAGRALDVAGGAGRNAIWIAQRGMTVTVVDFSEEALAVARARAAEAGVTLDCRALDLETARLPAGPWQLVVCIRYLQRSLFGAIAEALAPAGAFVFVQATTRSCERDPQRSKRFLLAEGEAAALVSAAGLTVVRHEESWSPEGLYEARLLAVKGPRSDS